MSYIINHYLNYITQVVVALSFIINKENQRKQHERDSRMIQDNKTTDQRSEVK